MVDWTNEIHAKEDKIVGAGLMSSGVRKGTRVGPCDQGKTEQAYALIRENKPEEAKAVFHTIEEQRTSHAKWKIFPALLTADEKGSFFEELWVEKMESCFKAGLSQLKTNEPSILTPYCINQILSHNLYLIKIGDSTQSIDAITKATITKVTFPVQ